MLALGPLQPAEEPAADARRLARAARRRGPSCACSGSSPSSPREPGHALRDGARATSRSTSCSTEATVFVQTSTHEGFALPPLESMATGGAVVCTDAHGNRDFCVDGENCLMPEASTTAVAARCSGCSATRSCASASAGRAAHGAGLRVGAADRRAGELLRGGGTSRPPRPARRGGAGPEPGAPGPA